MIDEPRVSTKQQDTMQAMADAFLADASNYDLTPGDALTVLARLAGFFQNEVLKVAEVEPRAVARTFAIRVDEERERFRRAPLAPPPLVLIQGEKP